MSVCGHLMVLCSVCIPRMHGPSTISQPGPGGLVITLRQAGLLLLECLNLPGMPPPPTRLSLPASYSAVPKAFPMWERSAPGSAPAEHPNFLCSLLASLALLVSQRHVSCLSGDSEPAPGRQTSKLSHQPVACNHTFFNGA